VRRTIPPDSGRASWPTPLEQTWNFLALAGYRFKPRKNLDINVFAGYRYLSIEYEKVATIDVDQKGPFLEVALEFH